MTTASPDTELWLRRYAPAPEADTVLVCFPHAGGSATFYASMARALAPAIDVLAVQYPGRQDRRATPCIDDLGTLAAAVLPSITPWTGRRIALFGHSMGAVVAFETARLLEEAGVDIASLIVSGRRAPSRHRDEFVHRRDDDGMIEELKSLAGTDTAVLGDEELIRMVLPAIRGDYRAAESYRYRPGAPLRCPVVALTGDNDPKAGLDEVEAWQEHTAGRFRFRQWPGGHFYLSQYQAEVLDLLRSEVGRG